MADRFPASRDDNLHFNSPDIPDGFTQCPHCMAVVPNDQMMTFDIDDGRVNWCESCADAFGYDAKNSSQHLEENRETEE